MKFSDEMISAYADGELQGSEKTEFETELHNDPELQQTLDDLHALKAQLRHTYESIKAPDQVQRKSANFRVAAYSAFLFLAFSSGWISSDLMHSPAIAIKDMQAEVLNKGMRAVTETPGKYILHIGMYDESKFKLTLDEAEALLSSYEKNNQTIQLEIIANAGGLNLFRDDASPYAQRVKQLSEKYPNIKFIACTNAIERLRERGIDPNLIQTIQQGPTALDQVVRRMNEGWTYIKI